MLIYFETLIVSWWNTAVLLVFFFKPVPVISSTETAVPLPQTNISTFILAWKVTMLWVPGTDRWNRCYVVYWDTEHYPDHCLHCPLVVGGGQTKELRCQIRVLLHDGILRPADNTNTVIFMKLLPCIWAGPARDKCHLIRQSSGASQHRIEIETVCLYLIGAMLRTQFYNHGYVLTS